MNPEYQLFILWEKALYQQEKILADMREHFSVLKRYEICWTPEFVSSNFTRFYGENLPDHSEKEQECGTGPFVLVIVRDNAPKYSYRQTTHGLEWVNTNMFDAKQRYRDWTGGGHKIHCSNSSIEFNHDITLLLGVNAEDLIVRFSEQKNAEECVETLSQDIIGARGWENLNQLLYVLNATVNYTIMRGDELLKSDNFNTEHKDIDLLLTKRQSAIYILNGTFYCNPLHPHILVQINGKEYIFDLWECEQGVYDPYWERNMLENRVLRKGYYALSDEDDFYSLIYHCLINKNKISEEYLAKLNSYKKHFNLSKSDWSQILVDYLAAKSYVVMLTNDAEVEVHLEQPIIKAYAIKYGTLRKRLCEEVEGKLFLSSVYEKSNSFVKKGTLELIENEARFLRQLDTYSYFPHIIKENYENNENFIEISRVLGENVHDFFKKKHKNNKVGYVRSFLQDSLTILEILEENNIIHRDFIPANILVSKSQGICHAALIDFGWAIYASELHTCITPPQLAGEYALPDKSSDIYSFTVLLKELWPNLQAVQNVVKQLNNNTKCEEVKIQFTLRDQFVMYTMRHKCLQKYVSKLHRHYRKIKREFKKKI